MSILETAPEQAQIPADTCYRKVGNKITDNILACGYLSKSSVSMSNVNQVFPYYGGLLLLQGQGCYSDRFGQQELHPGDFVQRIPGVAHSTIVKSDSGWKEFFICIGAGTYRELLSMGLLSGSPVLRGTPPKGMTREFSDLLEQMKKADERQLPTVYFRAQEILCRLTGCYRESNPAENRITRCVQLIDSSFGRITGTELAAELGISYETLRREFALHMGITMGKYAIASRMDSAKRELIYAKENLQQLACKLGYTDYFAFCRQFKQQVGCTPASYRKNNLPM